jgi:hypothetical protein
MVDAALAEPPAAEVGLRLDPGAGTVTAEATVRRAGAGQPLEVWLALYQDGLETAVERGENADRRLHNDRVVRRLERAVRLAARDREGSGRVELALDPEWPSEGLGVVAFAQDPKSMAILGAAAGRLGH